MKKTESLRKNRDFLKLYRSGKFYVGRNIVLYIKENKLQHNRLGISTAKNFGNSVERNRIRRLIRENYRELESQIPTGWDIIFSARKKKETQLPSFQEVGKEMRYLIRKLGLLS